MYGIILNTWRCYWLKFTELLILIKECYFKFDIVHAVSYNYHTIDQILILEYTSNKVIESHDIFFFQLL